MNLLINSIKTNKINQLFRSNFKDRIEISKKIDNLITLSSYNKRFFNTKYSNDYDLLILTREELIQQSKQKGEPKDVLGSPNCSILNGSLILTGLNASLCPAALVRDVYATFPAKYCRRLESKAELRELRQTIDNVVGSKVDLSQRSDIMCMGRELTYKKLK